jgi:TFIIF-interacting CTD phosphatase-like protein
MTKAEFDERTLDRHEQSSDGEKNLEHNKESNESNIVNISLT